MNTGYICIYQDRKTNRDGRTMNSPRWKWLYGRFRESGVFRLDIGAEFLADEKRRFVRRLCKTVRIWRGGITTVELRFIFPGGAPERHGGWPMPRTLIQNVNPLVHREIHLKTVRPIMAHSVIDFEKVEVC